MPATTRRPRIVLIGDLLADVWWLAGPSSRNIEHAAVALVSTPGSRKITAGGVGIVADALGRSNADVCLFSTVGEQPEILTALRRLSKIGVKTRGVFINPGFTTPIKTRYVNVNGHILLRHDVESPTTDHAGFDLDLLANLIKLGDIIVVSDYAKGCVTKSNRGAIVELARKFSKPIFVDTKPHIIQDYHGATGFKLNEIETTAIAGEHVAQLPSILSARAREKLDCKLFITTLGRDGAAWATNTDWGSVPAPRKYSSGNCVGAGDVFFAGFILGLFRHGNLVDMNNKAALETAIFWGLIAAGRRVRTNGFKKFSLDALRREIRQYCL